MKKEEKVKMYANIEAHGNNLNTIFNTGLNPIELCKKLNRIERKAHNATTCLCNTNTLHLMELNKHTGYDVKQTTEAEQDKYFENIKKQLIKILGKEVEEHFFINYDPRGYALKLKSEFCEEKKIYKDFGGYGIIAPDFTPSN